jgi:hypothetical protein
MKSVFKICVLILLFLSVSLLNSCKKDKASPPVVSTTSISEITYTTATSGGNVTDEGSSAVLTMGICWSTTPDPNTGNNKTAQNGSKGIFVSNIEQLSQNTKYYVKAYATSSAGTGYGNEVSFTTTAVGTPVLTTVIITSITGNSAISGGNITAENGGLVTVRGVCWGTTSNPTISDSKTTDGSGPGSFVSNLTGLSDGTLYHIRSYATNSAGTAYGEDMSFTTLGKPSLTTAGISGIKLSSAISGGNISSDGGSVITASGVCWSTTINPTISDSKTSDNAATGTFISNITGLAKQTTYHVRSYATNSVGTSYGENLSFTTPEIEWVESTDFPGEARWEALSFTYNGKGYYGLGRNSNNPAVENLKDFWTFDPTNSTWTRLQDCPFTFINWKLSSKCLVGSILYVFKEWALYSYDINSDTWQFLCNSPNSLSSISCFSVNDKAFFFDGHNSKLYEYVAQDNIFIDRSAVISGYLDFGLSETFVINNEAFLIHKGEFTIEIYHYISQSDTWEKKLEKEFSPLEFEKASFNITINNYAYIGQSTSFFASSQDDNAIVTADYPSTNVWRYDYVNNEFKQSVSLPGDFRAHAGFFSFENTGYVIGGATVDSNTQHFKYLNDVWILK